MNRSIQTLLCVLAIAPGVFAQQATHVLTTDANRWVWQSTVTMSAYDGTTTNLLSVDPNTVYQDIDGWGGCFSEIGWQALLSLSTAARRAVVGEMFDPASGCKFTLCRVPIGASDFALSYYSLNDSTGDYAMNNFSIARDRQHLIPFIKAAMEFQPALKIWGSPWTPPQWMKTNNHYAGGSIRWDPQTLTAYALYLAKFVESYRAEGINVYAVFTQNEPASEQTFPSCLWSGVTLRDFIRDYLGPTFRNRSVNAELWLGAINGGYGYWVEPAYTDPAASAFLTGTGFQWSGKDAIEETYQKHPDKRLMQTESECLDGENSWADAEYTFSLIKWYLDRGANSYMYWNLVLDENRSSSWGWRQNSLIVVNRTSRVVTYNPEFHLFKHFSYFVQPGARRIALSGSWSNALAFLNPDGDIVVVAANTLSSAQTLTVRHLGRMLKVPVPPRSVSTFAFRPAFTAVRVSLEANPGRLKVYAGNTSTITATIRDTDGNVVVDSTAPVTFALSGPGYLSGPTTVPCVNGRAKVLLKLTAQDSSGTAVITATSPGLAPGTTGVVVLQSVPYTGGPWTIPGRVELENFDFGGQGVAYHDTSAGNSGGAYRTTEDVDIEVCGDSGGGYNVAWTAAGEWLDYTVNVQTAGMYTIGLRAAIDYATTGNNQLFVDGVRCAAFTVPNTGGWQNWTTITSSGVHLEAGRRVLRFLIGQPANFNHLQFSLVAAAAPTKLAASAVPASLPADGVSIATITAAVQDAGGNIVYTATHTVHFSIIAGSAAIIGASSVRAQNGIATASIRVGLATGTVSVLVTSVGLSSAVAHFQIVPLVPPSVVLTSPLNGSTYTAPANITLAATASDPDGSIAAVRFYHGTTILNTDSASPYEYTWTSVAAGSYILTAQAVDNQGTVGISAAVGITVSAQPVYWTLTVTANPSNGGTVAQSPTGSSHLAGTQVNLTATPNAGYEFAGWTGDITGSSTTNPMVVVMDGDKTITANFRAVQSPQPSLNPGEVRIVGGLDGYINATVNPNVTIRFRRTSAGVVTVRIYDLRGRLVMEKTKDGPAGIDDDIAWNAADLPAGVYLARVKGGGVETSRRVVILR